MALLRLSEIARAARFARPGSFLEDIQSQRLSLPGIRELFDPSRHRQGFVPVSNLIFLVDDGFRLSHVLARSL